MASRKKKILLTPELKLVKYSSARKLV